MTGVVLDPEAVLDRVMAQVDRSDGCWMWTGRVDRDGYPVLWLRVAETTDGKRRIVAVHRLVYELLVGPIPPALTIDHLCHDQAVCKRVPCRHRRCLNPEDMEAVTRAVNTLRGGAPSAQNARKTGCGKCGGVLVATRSSGRRCKPCAAAYKREWVARRRAMRLRAS